MVRRTTKRRVTKSRTTKKKSRTSTTKKRTYNSKARRRLKNREYSIYIGLKIGTSKKMVENAVKRLSDILLKHGLKGYTQIQASGYWKGVSEPSIIVKFVNTYAFSIRKVYAIARVIKSEFKQEAVLVISDNVSYKFV